MLAFSHSPGARIMLLGETVGRLQHASRRHQHRGAAAIVCKIYIYTPFVLGGFEVLLFVFVVLFYFFLSRVWFFFI